MCPPVDRALRSVEWPSVKHVRVNLLAESAQIDFLEPTDKSTEEAVAILQEAIDDVGFDAKKKKSLVIVDGSVGQATATLREVVLVAELQPTEVAGVPPGPHCRQRRSGTAGELKIRGSVVVSISACHAEDPGSIPGRGECTISGFF